MENTTNSSLSGHGIPSHPARFIITASFFMLISITGLVGNCLTIVSVFLCTKLRTKTNIFVVNLAFGDLMICLFIPIEVLALLSPGEPPVPDILKTVLAIVLTVSMYNTISTLAVVAFMRCVKITKPPGIFDALFTMPKISLILTCSWALPTLINTMILYLGGLQISYDPDARLFRPGIPTPDGITPLVVCSIIDGIHVVLSTCVICISYIKIFLHVRASTRQIAAVVDEVQAATQNQPPIALEHRNHEPAARQERPNQMADNRFRAREVKVTKNLALVTVVFLLCFLPFPIAANSSNPYLLTFGMFVVWSNSAMNPFIYAAKHADFRKVFRCILSGSFKKIPFPSRLLRAMLQDQ